jgi:hypothetical protein
MKSTARSLSLITLLVCGSNAAAQTPALPDAVDRFIRAELTRHSPYPGFESVVGELNRAAPRATT